MITNPFSKSVYRQPVRLLFFIVLIGVISFMFIGRVVESMVVIREINRLSDFYKTVGNIRLSEDNTTYGISDGAQIISESEYLAFEDRRRVVNGVLDGIYNSDISGLSSSVRFQRNSAYDPVQTTDVLFAGVLTEIEFSAQYGGYKLYFDIDTLLDGYPDYFDEELKAVVWFKAGKGDEIFAVTDELQKDNRYLIRAYFDRGLSHADFINQHLHAYRYLSHTPLTTKGRLWFPLKPDERVDLSNPDLKGIRDDMELVNANQHSMAVITTVDMSAMPQTQPSSRTYFLEDGRFINSSDNSSKNLVCVISSDFALLRGLSVGDTITMTLRDVKKTPAYGYIPYNDNEISYWREYETVKEKFEIVGIYNDMRLAALSFPPFIHYSNIMFIPESVLPAGFGSDNPSMPDLIYGESDFYSFTLKSPFDQEAFIMENREALSELGMEISMSENGALNFFLSSTPIKNSLIFGSWMFGFMLLLALLLSSLLYIHYSKKDFAILRALGVTKGDAVKKMLAPITISSLGAIVSGGVFSWKYALAKATETLSKVQVLEGETLSASLSPIWLVLLCTAVFAALFVLMLTGTLFLAKRPVLEALQGTGLAKKTAKANKENFPDFHSDPHMVHNEQDTDQYQFKNNKPVLLHRRSTHISFMVKSLLRSGIKSLLVIIVAFSFVLGLNWMSRVIRYNTFEIERLYDTSVIALDITRDAATGLTPMDKSENPYNYIGQNAVQAMLDTGFIKNVDLSSKAMWNGMTVPLPPDDTSTDFYDLERRISPVNLIGVGSAADFRSDAFEFKIKEFADGYSESIFREDWSLKRLRDQAAPFEIPNEKWEGYKQILSSRVSLHPLQNLSVPILLTSEIMDRWNLNMGDVILISRGKGDNTRIEFWMVTFVIAGCYDNQQTGFEEDVTGQTDVILPVSALKSLERMTRSDFAYSSATFTVEPALNREFLEMRKEINQIINQPGFGSVNLNAIIWDSELRSVVEPMEKNLQLMSVLYPVTVSLSALIAMGIAFLMMIKNTQNASILRVLGVSRLNTRLILCYEHMLLVIFGLVLGFIVTAILYGNTSSIFEIHFLINGGMYLLGATTGTIYGAIRITKSAVLELLQVKE